ncbi:MAG: hypothetical protein GY909_16500 [Oligoflexia bacterium]|nr:hypothetical protein [Oligoflexia bacterium]
MFKPLALSAFLFVSTQATDIKTASQKAPLEWLIAQTVQLKSIESERFFRSMNDDQLIKEILQVVNYDSENDELIIPESENISNVNDLRAKLIDYISNHQLSNFKKPIDKLYMRWLGEKGSPREVSASYYDEQRSPIKGHYYFNHVHTNISQDNKSLKLLKFTPKKTYRVMTRFLEKRDAIASTAIADHRTDKAYDELKPNENEHLFLLRGVEWGGSTHMGLVGIKKNWDLLYRGNEFKGEESIIKSRSSEGFRIVNHPNRKGPFSYKSWLDVNGVEIWNTILENAPFYQLGIKRSDNRGAKAQWEQSLKEGKRYVAVGGSDFHFTIPCMRDRTLHYPANFIPSNDPSQTKENLMNGNVSFLTRPTAPKLSLYANNVGGNNTVGMGETISNTNELNVHLYADFSDTKKRMSSLCYNTIVTFARTLTFWKKQRWEVRFYNQNNQLIAKKTINPKKHKKGKSLKVSFNYSPSANDLVRAEIWSINKKKKEVDLIGATNPIYIRQPGQ